MNNDPVSLHMAFPPTVAVCCSRLCLQVVQVYNYMLTPLLTFVHNNGSGDTGTSSSSSSESQAPTVVAGPGGLGAAEVAKAAAAAAAAAAGKDTATLSGWTLKLIMELCDQVRRVLRLTWMNCDVSGQLSGSAQVVCAGTCSVLPGSFLYCASWHRAPMQLTLPCTLQSCCRLRLSCMPLSCYIFSLCHPMCCPPWVSVPRCPSSAGHAAVRVGQGCAEAAGGALR